MKIPIIALRVLDQQRALDFYTQVLGFTVTEDMDLGAMRWLTVSPPGAPDSTSCSSASARRSSTPRPPRRSTP